MTIKKLCSNILLICTFCVMASGCSWIHEFLHPSAQHDPVEKTAPETIRVYRDALENIKVVRAQNSPFPELLNLMGKVSITEDRTTMIPSRVAGRIETIYFASGERVQAGQVLATLFSPDFISAREEYLQSIKQQRDSQSAGSSLGGALKADASDFANLAEMSRKKLSSMGLSPNDIRDIEQNGKGESRPMLQVRAPRSGVLIQKNAVLGNLVNVGDTLFMIGDLTKVWFSGDIYPEDLTKVRKDQDVFINAVGVDKPLFGKVSFISPLVDPTSRSIKIRALMDNPNDALKADEYVQGSVILNQHDAIVIPTVSVVRNAEDLYIFKKISPSSIESGSASLDFKRVKVTLGAEQSGLVAVTSGLSDGDELVSEGALLLDAALNSSDTKADSSIGNDAETKSEGK